MKLFVERIKFNKSKRERVMINKIIGLLYVIPIVLFAQAYTLENCETNISGNTPEFFQKYFQCVDASLSESGNYINVYFNGLAPYESWYYPDGDPNHIDWVSQGQGSFLIPNAYITEVNYVVSIPVNPEARPNLIIDGDAVDGEVGTNNYEYPMGSVGSALNGVNMFNPCASPPDIIEDEAASFDLYSGHPAGGELYHYHTTSQGPLEVLEHKGLIQTTTVGSGEIEVYGIMCDGTVVLGCTELDGSSPNNSDFDAQNGHVHDMVDEDGTTMFTNRYHTHICYDDITEDDTDGNGFQEHEFTPEISYYETPGMGQSFNRCRSMTSPIEGDMLALGDELIPSEFSLYQNYPNPFNPVTSIDYNLSQDGRVELAIFDLAGKKIRTLVRDVQSAGLKTIEWDASNDFGQPVSAGLYIYQLKTSQGTFSKKMLLLK
jgi:hypothetical protein